MIGALKTADVGSFLPTAAGELQYATQRRANSCSQTHMKSELHEDLTFLGYDAGLTGD